MVYEIVAITPDNLDELSRVAHTAFGEEANQQRIDDEELVIEYDRMLGVSDEGRLVASAGVYSMELTVPGGALVPMAGVTWVSCLPTHRRRGILNSMMRHQLDDVAARGECLAGLTASEAVIYNRYGYGVATQYVEAHVDNTAFSHAPRAEGRIRLMSAEESPKVVPPLFDAWRRQRVGSVDRSEGRWKQILLDREWDRRGGSAAFRVVHENAHGEPDGYATYRSKRPGENTVLVEEVISLDSEVEAALWQFVFSLDLIRKYHVWQPLDSQLPWRLADQRAYVTVNVRDHLWLRVVDTAAALSARTYATDDTLVLEVTDVFRPDGAAAGRFRLTSNSCTRESSAAPDISTTVEALGSAYLGGVSWNTLAAAGRASGSADALQRADRMFVVTRLPFNNTDF